VAEPGAWARMFHEAYERMAPQYGYITRRASAVPWDEVPEPNRRLMEAVAAEVAPAISRQYPEVVALVQAALDVQMANQNADWCRFCERYGGAHYPECLFPALAEALVPFEGVAGCRGHGLTQVWCDYCGDLPREEGR